MHPFAQIKKLRQLALQLHELELHHKNITNTMLQEKITSNIHHAINTMNVCLRCNIYKLMKSVFDNQALRQNISKIHDYISILKHCKNSNIQNILLNYRYIFFDALCLDKHSVYRHQLSVIDVKNAFYKVKANDNNIILHIKPSKQKHTYHIAYIASAQLKYWYTQAYKEIHISTLAQLIAVDTFIIDEAYIQKDTNWLSVAKSNFSELKYNLYLGMSGGVSPYSDEVIQSFRSNLSHNGDVPVIGLNHIANSTELVQVLVRLMYLQNLFDAITSSESLQEKYKRIQSTNFYIYYDLIHKTKHFIYRHSASSQHVIKLFQHQRNQKGQFHILSVGRLHYYNENIKRSVGPLEIITYIPNNLFNPIKDMYRTYRMI